MQQFNDPRTKEFLGLIVTLKKSGNPEALLYSMMDSNPEMKELLNTCGTPEKAFYLLAKQTGVDPDMILKMCNNVLNHGGK